MASERARGISLERWHTIKGFFLTPGFFRMACKVDSVCLSTCSGQMSTLVTTKNTGTFRARATPMCSLHMPTMPTHAISCQDTSGCREFFLQDIPRVCSLFPCFLTGLHSHPCACLLMFLYPIACACMLLRFSSQIVHRGYAEFLHDHCDQAQSKLHEHCLNLYWTSPKNLEASLMGQQICSRCAVGLQ